MSRLVAAAFCIVTAALHAAGPAFDVTSVKPSARARAGGEGSGREGVAWTPVSLTIQNASLSFCVQWAYGVKFYQVSGPDWSIHERYDVLGKTDRPVAVAQLRRMLRTLLSDRFCLAIRRDTRELAVYALVAGAHGAKLRAAAGNEESELRVVDGSFVFTAASMPELAGEMSGFAGMDRPVVDQTGISGVFDLTLKSAAQKVRDGDIGGLFAAIEGIGLKLESRKAPVEVIVIQNAQRPSAN